ncbi:HYC_CC_PP family protein [Robiginitalea sp.]|uniref:HYC_CC_PP family protein n=1 Tax=Robiginitalea sp. TaxID=1902411 RepID=UPI003C37529B
MKAIVFKIASLFMALLVLFSTFSFSVGMHFCGDHLVDLSLFESAEACAMNPEPATTASSCENLEMDMDCCSDVAFVVEGQQELNLSFEPMTFEQQLFVTSFVYSYIRLFEGPLGDTSHFKDYAPPPLIRDVQILDQTFLI